MAEVTQAAFDRLVARVADLEVLVQSLVTSEHIALPGCACAFCAQARAQKRNVSASIPQVKAPQSNIQWQQWCLEQREMLLRVIKAEGAIESVALAMQEVHRVIGLLRRALQEGSACG